MRGRANAANERAARENGIKLIAVWRRAELGERLNLRSRQLENGAYG